MRYPPSKKQKIRWKTTPAKLDSAAVFHLPQQIERMIAEHVPASNNEVQMHGVSSATHHHALTLGKLPQLWVFSHIFRTLRRRSNSLLGMRAVQFLTEATLILK